MKDLKNKYNNWKRNKRYKKFKDCSLPYPFWDESRDTFEWVYYNKNCKPAGYDTQNSLYEALGKITSSGVTYHYEAFMYGQNDSEHAKPKYQMIRSHCHSFDELVEHLYRYPESFHIPDDCLNEYSNQELRYLTKVQSYLKAIGLTDEKESPETTALNVKWEEIDNKESKNIKDRIFLSCYSKKWNKLNEAENLKRYCNEKASLYSSYHPLYIEKEEIVQSYLNGKKDYILSRKYSFDKETEIENCYIIVNPNNEYCGILEVMNEEIIPFKDLKEDMVDYKLAGYKRFSDYKEHLYHDYQERGKRLQEEFTEDSLMTYLKVKVLERM